MRKNITEVARILQSQEYYRSRKHTTKVTRILKKSLHNDFYYSRDPDKARIVSIITHISSPNRMFDHLLESSDRDESYKWSIIGFDKKNKRK